MTCPEGLKTDLPLLWSPGTGTEVWRMLAACAAGDLETVEELVTRNPALVRCHHCYRKPLYFAVRENRLAVAEYLMERDPDPVGLAVHDSLLEIAADRGYEAMRVLLEEKLAAFHNISREGEPVAAAIRAGDLAAVKALLDAAPALLRAGDARGNLPIHWAVMTRRPEMIDELLARGADLSAKRADGARPIQLSNGDYHFRGWRDVPAEHPFSAPAILTYLRERGAVCDMCTAAHTGDTARVRELLAADPGLANEASDYGSYYPGAGRPLWNAAAAGHREIVELLLDHGADPNLPEEGIAPRGKALYSAAANGHHDIAALLLDHGADPNAEVESSADALSRAVSNNDQRMIDLLCAHGAARPLSYLAYYNDLRTAAAMFAANPALANDPDALLGAATPGFARLMLRYQPDLASRVCGAAENPEVTRLLFARGMKANEPDWLGITPLHQLARRGDLPMAALFLEHGADLHARDEDIQSTPLGWAAKFGQAEMARFLLEQGADPDPPGGPSWAAPLAWARRRGHAEIAAMVLDSGALSNDACE